MAIGRRVGEVFTEINVTPLTDVFLVLLVIMILVAPLANSTILKVEPPQKPHQTTTVDDKSPKIKVTVTAGGKIILNDKVVSPPDTAGVAAAIKREQQLFGKTDIPLNLQSESDALQKNVVAVMDASAGCGIKQLHVLPLKTEFTTTEQNEDAANM